MYTFRFQVLSHFRNHMLSLSGFLTQELTGAELTIMGAGTIFTTNANRKFATGNGIRTDICRKSWTYPIN